MQVAADNAGKDANAYRLAQRLRSTPPGRPSRSLDEPHTCTQLFHTMDAGGLREHKLPPEYSTIQSATLEDYEEKLKGEYKHEPGMLPEDDRPERTEPERRLIPLPDFPRDHDPACTRLGRHRSRAQQTAIRIATDKAWSQTRFRGVQPKLLCLMVEVVDAVGSNL